MKYNPALDGIRAMAVFAVIAFHSVSSMFSGGYLGVDVFFVLSGYLITSILRNELQGTGEIDLKRFYIRRAARLMPPLALCLVITYAVYRVIEPNQDLAPDVILGLLYVSDYGKAWLRERLVLGHTWSLSVEEHFYLLWPAFLLLTRRMDASKLFRLLLMMFLAATTWRMFNSGVADDWYATYFRFDTRLSGLILGSILATKQWKLPAWQAGVAGTVGVGCLGVLLLTMPPDIVPGLVVGEPPTEFATAILIIAMTSGHPTRIYLFLSNPAMVYLGRLSYSMYLWHYPISFAMHDTAYEMWSLPASFAGSFALAALSYRFVEKPIRAWAHRITQREAVSVDNRILAG